MKVRFKTIDGRMFERAGEPIESIDAFIRKWRAMLIDDLIYCRIVTEDGLSHIFTEYVQKSSIVSVNFIMEEGDK